MDNNNTSLVDKLFLGTVVMISTWTWNDVREAWISRLECDWNTDDTCDESERVRRNIRMRYLFRFAVYMSLTAFAIVYSTTRIQVPREH